jgi:outer membrane receptor protein involved in Fe transport
MVLTLPLCAALFLFHAEAAPAADAAAANPAVAAAGAGDTTAADSGGAGTSQSAQTGSMLQEVIVTAEKRAQPVLAVPQSITVMPEATLQALNIQSFTDYAAQVPNLSYNVGGNGGSPTDSTRVTIRGVVGQYTTSMYIDDTPIPQSEDPRIVDIARIEVLKGPQGTLYGASAIGGTVRIITNQPSLTRDESRFMLQGGTTEHAGSPDFGGQAVANVVVVPDVFGVRLSGFINHDGGFVTRTYPAAEGSNVIFNDSNTGENYEYGGAIAALWQITEDFKANLKLLVQRKSYPNGFPSVYRGLPPNIEPTSLTVNRTDNVVESSLDDWDLPALTLTYTRPTWNFVSSTSAFRNNTFNIQDLTEAEHALFNVPGYDYYSNFGSVIGGGDASFLEFNEEDRFTWDPTKDINLIVGAYLEHDQSNSNGLPRSFPTIVGLTLPNIGLVTTPNYFASSSVNTYLDKSIFANLDYTFLKIVTATAGIRFFNINQIFKSTSWGFIINQQTPKYQRQQQFNHGNSPRFALSVQPGANTNIYASAAKGFRRGGGAGYVISLQCYPELASLGLTPQQLESGYKPDTLWTYELGAKQALFNHAMLATAAVYDTEWSGIQQNVTLGSCGQHFTTNAGAARIKGAEFSLTGNVAPGLSMSANYGYSDGRITDNAHGTTVEPVGARIYGEPLVNASLSATYNRPITGALSGFLSADWAYTGSWYSPNNSATAPLFIEAHEIVNARIGVDSGKNEFTLYVNNVLNRLAALGDAVPPVDRTIISGGSRIVYERQFVTTPRTIGLQYRHGF